MIEIGLKHTSELTVTDTVTAIQMGSGDMPVLATPAMLALMENAAMLAVADELPEYGSNRRIEVKLVNGEIAITNAHLGCLGDILTYQIDVAPDLQVTKMQLLDEILKEMSSNTFSDEEQAEFWDDFDNLQKAKIVR